MIHLSLRSEYSFGEAYGPITEIAKLSEKAVGIADLDGTFGHYKLFKLCQEKGVKPILGVRLQVVDFKEPKVKKWGAVYIFIAKSNDGLVEIHELVKLAYDNFYYHPFVELKSVTRLSENVIVIAEYYHDPTRIDYLGLSPFTPKTMLETSTLPRVAVDANRYLSPEDREVYELLMGEDRQESLKPQYVLTEEQHLALFNDQSAIDNTYAIAEMCNVSFTPATMVRYKGTYKLRNLCIAGARAKDVDLSSSVYSERLEREIAVIEQRNFQDYFLIVADMIEFAKTKMFVGPSRGSSAGSLVCYLLGITEVDPIKHGLLFERFVDLNRKDLPDIDVDFPDFKRSQVIKYLKKVYGDEYVSHIATVSRLKPKSAINIFAKNLCVPFVESESVKESLIERWDGDERSNNCIQDTFESTDIGKVYIERYPKMRLAEKIEGHASHTGTHAAGIIVCNDKLTQFGGVNSRDDIVMLDMKEAEGLNLLKIDCLGLRTLSILEEVADRIGMPYSAYYSLPLDDRAVFKTFNDHRFYGIFQFEGQALQNIARSIGVDSFEDITAITSLARPGPMIYGGTGMFVDRKLRKEPVTYLSNHSSVVEATKETLGVIVYQEQFMKIAREFGGMEWSDVSALRRAISKSMGGEFLGKFRETFITGAKENGISEVEAHGVWTAMLGFASYGFNKSHAVGYGLVSYWTAWAKTHHPYEYAAACLNNASSEEASVRILRDMVKHDGVKYTPIDPDESTERWEVVTDEQGKFLVGALTAIDGIGITKAKDIVARRKAGTMTANQVLKLLNATTPYDVLFPAMAKWSMLYNEPQKYGLDRKLDLIENIRGGGDFVFIGRLLSVHLRDLNEYEMVSKRGGKVYESNSLMLNMTVEDDTDSILCSIDRFKFEKIGRAILERGKPKQDWYLIRGTMKDKFRRVDIQTIFNLGEWNHEG